MNLVDVHSHLNHGLFKKDLEQVLDRAEKAGLKAVLVSGVNPPTNKEVLTLSRRHSIIKASMGIYPIDALGLAPDDTGLEKYKGKINIEKEFKFFQKNNESITAIGEVGLDYKYGEALKIEQKQNFRQIIQETEKLDKPMVVHTRKAEADCVEMLESSSLKHVILHSFEGNKKLIKRAADAGFSFSVPPTIVRSNHFQMMAELVDIKQLLTETDAPWLSPFKDKRNEPAFVLESIKKIAEIKNMKAEQAAGQIYKNYLRIFSR